MGSRRREKRESILCTDENGRTVIVDRYVTVVIHTPLSGPPGTADGSEDFVTADGQDVIDNGDGTFTLVLTDEILTRVK